MSACLRRQRFRILLLPTVLLSAGLLYIISANQYQIRNALSYATRPIWDSDDGPQTIIPHYYAEEMPIDPYACQLHGWQEREGGPYGVIVLDAILMSSELDLLEIRMNELDDVVDRFFILESNATFTGLPKETYFANNRDRFASFERKISYRFLPGYPLKHGQEAFDVEAKTRDAMTLFLKSHMAEFAPDAKPMVIMSDIDEIPSAHTLRLLKVCDFGKSIHLQLRNFLYSFEWFIGFNSWRASVTMWQRNSFYRHSKSGDIVLADAGWHCSYCFRTIAEYVIKMKGFSHSDRIGGRMDLLDPNRIQTTICRGKDIFGMLPEAYSFVDLFSQMRLEPQRTAVGLPRFLIENAQRFKFLLPGGCIRQTPSTATPTPAAPGDDLER